MSWCMLGWFSLLSLFGVSRTMEQRLVQSLGVTCVPKDCLRQSFATHRYLAILSLHSRTAALHPRIVAGLFIPAFGEPCNRLALRSDNPFGTYAAACNHTATDPCDYVYGTQQIFNYPVQSQMHVFTQPTCSGERWRIGLSSRVVFAHKRTTKTSTVTWVGCHQTPVPVSGR